MAKKKTVAVEETAAVKNIEEIKSLTIKQPVMAKAATKVSSKKIDDTYTQFYTGGVTINPLAVLKENISFLKDVNSNDYIPSSAVFYFERPDLDKKYVLSGKFREMLLSTGKINILAYPQDKAAGSFWLDKEGNVIEDDPVIIKTFETNSTTNVVIPLEDVVNLGEYELVVTNPFEFGNSGSNISSYNFPSQMFCMLYGPLNYPLNLVFTYKKGENN